MNEIYVVCERSDGTLAHLAMQIAGVRFPSRPATGGWYQTGDGTWAREPSDANIEAEVKRQADRWLALDNVTVTRWRRLTDEEHQKFGEYRNHRDAMILDGDTVTHDMVKARELHKHLLRHQRAEKLLILDGVYNGASAAKDKTKMDAIETLRQGLRDLTSDPAIEAATTIEKLSQIGLTEDGELAMEALRAELRTL